MHRLLLLFAVFFAASVSAQEADEAILDFAGDHYMAGETVTFSGAAEGDLFGAGNRVTVAGDVAGSGHLAGRRVRLEGDVAGNLYAAGMDVAVSGATQGNATVTGYSVALSGDIGGNLRSSGADVTLSGNVGGSALVTAETLALDGQIDGDLLLLVENATFGPDAFVTGTLMIDKNAAERFDIPESVVASDRRVIVDFDGDLGEVSPVVDSMKRRAFSSILFGFLQGVVVMLVILALLIGLAPEWVAAARIRALDAPGRALLAGFLAVSCLIGSGILLAMTLIGLLLTPAAIVLAALAMMLGYVLGAYILGVGIWRALGRDLPETFWHKLGLAALGVVLVGLVAMLPVIGWILTLGLILIGFGAVAWPWWQRLTA